MFFNILTTNKMKRILTGKELKFAAVNGLPVWYEEKYHNPYDKHMNFIGKCIMEEAEVGYYIGNSDIDTDDFQDDDMVSEDFEEGTYKVCAIKGVNYAEGRR